MNPYTYRDMVACGCITSPFLFYISLEGITVNDYPGKVGERRSRRKRREGKRRGGEGEAILSPPPIMYYRNPQLLLYSSSLQGFL